MTATMLDLINAGDFRKLFLEELGWTRPDQPPLAVDVDGDSFQLTQVAGYKGVRVWTCPVVPDRRRQRLIDHAVKKISNERLLIFHDATHQEWRWPQSSDTQGRSQPRLVTHQHYVGKDNPALIQRLGMVRLGISESPTVVELLQRMRRAFDAERITTAFYKQFLTQHQSLVKALKGLTSDGDREWYSALLLNRLMFVYFMQRKGFMDGDPNYLRTRLDRLQQLQGKGHFYEFYRDLLMPLFHAGLGSPQREFADQSIKQLVGDVPYINGGIFAVHPLEEAHEISVGDDVFRSIFDLFDGYQWHLDDRPTADPNEINPDVLGYIFEQFINQKEQGAYYTHEDVTHFMTGSTLVPVFLERLEGATQVNPWQRVQAEPSRYIWEGLGYGLEQPRPKAVEEQASELVRPAWCEKAPATHGMAGETWWEVERRRTVHTAVTKAAQSGGIANVDAGISHNMDLESLAIDVIDGLDTPSDVVSAWNILTGLKIIDPTCGSGAFLFAALKIIQSLYGAVLDAAESHADTARDPQLQAILDAAKKHPSREYFILKHATLSNLYGVDLMHEAVEIARLRLFLKLVSAVDRRDQIEPLPDLDFNIKPGNVLVGAVDTSAIHHQSDDLFADETVAEVLLAAEGVTEAYQAFRSAQVENDDDATAMHRQELRERLTAVRETVDRQYFKAQGLPGDEGQWRASHQPFHWFVEYPDVMQSGGFDVVIGNPPYVAKSKVKSYSYRGFKSDALPDIYAPCTERASQITRANGRFALILPISAQFGGEFTVLRQHLAQRFGHLWVCAFSRNPAALFSAGLGVRSTIVIGASGPGTLHTTKTHRWYDEYRPALFETLEYTRLAGPTLAKGWLRPTSDTLLELFNRLLTDSGTVANAVRPVGTASVGFKVISLYWLSVFLDDPPCYTLEGDDTPQTKIGRLKVADEEEALILLGLLATKLAFVWWYCTGDDFDVTSEGLKSLPVNPLSLSAGARAALKEGAQALLSDLPNHVMFTKYAGKWMGNYVHSEMRDITDEMDLALAQELGYEDLLPALEHAYHCVYKPTGDRPGTLRSDPFSRG